MSRHCRTLVLIGIAAVFATPIPAHAQFGAIKNAARRQIEKQIRGDSTPKGPAATTTSTSPNATAGALPNAAPGAAPAPSGGISGADVDVFVRAATAVAAEYERLRPSLEYARTSAIGLRNEAITECKLGGPRGFAASQGVDPDSLRRLLVLSRGGYSDGRAVEQLNQRFMERGLAAANEKLVACMDGAPTLASFAPAMRAAAATIQQQLGVDARVEAKPVIGSEDAESAKSMGGATDFQFVVDPGALRTALRRHLMEVRLRELGPQWDAGRYGQMKELVSGAIGTRAPETLPRFDASGREAIERNRAALERLFRSRLID